MYMKDKNKSNINYYLMKYTLIDTLHPAYVSLIKLEKLKCEPTNKYVILIHSKTSELKVNTNQTLITEMQQSTIKTANYIKSLHYTYIQYYILVYHINV